MFNHITVNGADMWYPTILSGANLNIDRAAMLAKYGAESQDRAALFIRYQQKNGKILISGKEWMPPKAWDGRENAITLATDGDFFWAGQWTEGPVSDGEYRDGFYSWMNKTKDDVYAITSVARYSVIPHFEVMGK